MRLNPRWLYAAHVRYPDGSRRGTIGQVHADGSATLCSRREGGMFKLSVADLQTLDAAGRDYCRKKEH